MISREDFAFTIGYDGAVAVVDGKAKKQYGSLTTMQLAEEGLYRAAFASALFSKNEEEMRAFIAFFNEKARTSFTKPEQLMRLFGVVLENVNRVLVL
jgi:hypothetical protein